MLNAGDDVAMSAGWQLRDMLTGALWLECYLNRSIVPNQHLHKNHFLPTKQRCYRLRWLTRFDRASALSRRSL